MAGVDAVVHFAAETHVDRSNAGADEFLRTNVTGTFTLLEAARERKLGRFVAIGTDEVYGSVPRGASREVDPLNPSNPYSASKAAADLLARAYWTTHRLPVVVTRSSNNFGPYQYPEKMIPLFVTNALEGKPLPLYGDGKNVRDWLYVLDNCAAMDLVLRKGEDGEIYNIGGGNEVENIVLTRQILRLTGKPETLITPVADRPGHDRRYALDARRPCAGLEARASVSRRAGEDGGVVPRATRPGGGPSSRASSARTTSASTPRGERACDARADRSRAAPAAPPARRRWASPPRRGGTSPRPDRRRVGRHRRPSSGAWRRPWWGSGWRPRRTRPPRPSWARSARARR